ncbi:MAG: FGGY-family carbohydrate kinase [Candidatus Dormibacteraeota bacterium]|nr:FGGY-family carbohydrate kinase [Candidatus Dormibacteraeota bacterium]
MKEPWILAIDLGTGGPKTGAVTLTGELLAHSIRSVPTDYTSRGRATQETADWWRGIREGVAALLANGVVAEDLVGVGITGQWGSTVPVDSSGEAAGPCLLWADSRGGPYSAQVLGGLVRVVGYAPATLWHWLRLTGGAPSPHGADPLGHHLLLRHELPEIYARTATLMEPLDFLGLRLTGRRAATPASMILSWLTDNRNGGRAEYSPTLVRRSGRERALLPELLPTGGVLGGILPAVAEELGLPAGVPVVAGVPDLHTGYIGSGAVAPYAGHLSISTTAWVSCEVPFKRTDVLHQMASVPGVRRGTYLVANNHETAGLCLQWLRDSVLTDNGETPGYDQLTALAATAPAGAGGVIFTPWLNGERSPVEDRSLRAAFLNVSMATDRSHLVRAVLEGVAFNARWLLDAVEKFVRRDLPSLRIFGGGACSPLWCQIHADILGRPIELVAEPMHTNLRGAALFAGMSLGRLRLDDVPGRVRVVRTFEPGTEATTVYAPMYREYQRLYRRLRGTYATLNGRS